jgi:hypothetical protein
MYAAHSPRLPFRGRAGTDEERDHERRDDERHRVQQQCPGRADGDHEHAAEYEADDLRRLPRDRVDRGAHHVQLAVQHLGQHRRAGRREGRRTQLREEQQHQERGERHARDHHQPDERRPHEVGHDHHGPPGDPVGEAGEQRAADEPRQEADRVRQRGQQRRARPGVHEDGQRHARELVPDQGQHVRRPQRPELPHREDVAEGRRYPHTPHDRGIMPDLPLRFGDCDPTKKQS